jgi:hypothetical protein
LGEALDEEPRQLGLETGTVGDFMQRTGLPLFGGPVFIDESG